MNRQNLYMLIAVGRFGSSLLPKECVQRVFSSSLLYGFTAPPSARVPGAECSSDGMPGGERGRSGEVFHAFGSPGV